MQDGKPLKHVLQENAHCLMLIVAERNSWRQRNGQNAFIFKTLCAITPFQAGPERRRLLQEYDFGAILHPEESSYNNYRINYWCMGGLPLHSRSYL